MKDLTIEDLANSKDKNIDYEVLQSFFNEKLQEIYEKDKAIPILDYADIRYSAMIDLLYEMMPSLKEDISENETGYKLEKTI